MDRMEHLRETDEIWDEKKKCSPDKFFFFFLSFAWPTLSVMKVYSATFHIRSVPFPIVTQVHTL